MTAIGRLGLVRRVCDRITAVSIEHEQSTTQPSSTPVEPIARYSRAWSAYYAVVALGVVAAVLAESETAAVSRGVAVGAIVAIAVLYGVWGRHGRAGLPFIVVLLAVFA